MNKFQKLIRKITGKKSSSRAGTSGKRLRHGKKKALSKKAKIWIAVGGSVGVLLIAGVVFGILWFKSTFDYEHDPITEDPGQLGVDENIEYPDEITNIALFGLDSRAKKPEGAEYQRGLSDSIMIISVNETSGSIKLVSVMRDTLVKVEGHGYQKINAAYSLGGPELAIKTLNQTFRMNIQEYATVDFEGMAEIVDAVGGVEVELTRAEIYQTNLCMEEIARVRGLKRSYVTQAGKQTLNGIQAVSFARIRAVPTINGTRDDYGRTERQRLVMTRLFEKALQLPMSKYPSLIKAMLPYIQTSMGYDDIFDLAKVLKADGITMQQNRLPVEGSVITSGLSVPYIGSCVYYDLEYSADILHAFFFDNVTFEEYVEKNGIRKNNWYGAAGFSDTFIPPAGSETTTDSAGKPTSSNQTASSNKNTSSGNTTTSSGQASSSTSTSTGNTDVTTDSGTTTDSKPTASTSLPILPSTDTSSGTPTDSATNSVTDSAAGSSGSSTTDETSDAASSTSAGGVHSTSTSNSVTDSGSDSVTDSGDSPTDETSDGSETN